MHSKLVCTYCPAKLTHLTTNIGYWDVQFSSTMQALSFLPTDILSCFACSKCAILGIRDSIIQDPRFKIPRSEKFRSRNLDPRNLDPSRCRSEKFRYQKNCMAMTKSRGGGVFDVQGRCFLLVMFLI